MISDKSSRNEPMSKTQNMARQLNVGCLFAAIGGFCRAFEEVGATIAWANEKDRFAAETFRLNFPHTRCLNKPIEELSVKDDSLEPVDVLTAGFLRRPRWNKA
jgi:DNA (cytosine-5)-methyltransferase 1